MAEDEPKDPPDAQPEDDGSESEDTLVAQDDYYEEPNRVNRVFDYIETDKGHENVQKFVVMTEGLAPKIGEYLDALIKIKTEIPKIEFKKWLYLLVIRFLVFVFALGVVVYMKRSGNVDPTITLLIGGLVAYFFGYARRQ